VSTLLDSAGAADDALARLLAGVGFISAGGGPGGRVSSRRSWQLRQARAGLATYTGLPLRSSISWMKYGVTR
jgi:hypothetical protein